MAIFRSIFTLVAALALTPAAIAQSKEEDLSRIDAALDMAHNYEASHSLVVESLEERLAEPGLTLQEAYDLYDELFRVQFSYKFDLANDAVDRKAETAASMNDRQKISETAVDKAYLLCVAGMYLESQEAALQIDTTVLSHRKLVDYYYYKQRFYFDYHDNSPGKEVASRKDLVSYYRNRVFEETDSDASMNGFLRVREAIDEGRLEVADSLGSLLLSAMDRYSHEYAELAYYKAVVCRDLGRSNEMMHWFANSAIADITSSTKDNASLQSIAVELMNRNEEIERAFRYTKYSLNDAVFYNAKLRPWQIAMSLPAIEKAYNESRAAHERRKRILMAITLTLSLLMTAVTAMLIYLYFRQERSQKKIEAMNKQIKSTLQDLSLANAAKEEYLGLFLSMCSKYIDKLRKYVSRSEAEAEIESFYRNFDDAFLNLYPDFVEKFNSLLKPEARIELKKDESLNTELRIFALIKLGITQSSHIATLLRYSVNTIYNYRAQIKNAALDGKDAFEDRIKEI